MGIATATRCKAMLGMAAAILASTVGCVTNPHAELVEAARSGNAKDVDSLLAIGAEINYENEQGYTPLRAAVWENRKEIVKLLLAKGANVNHIHKDGFRVINVDARYDVDQLLIDAGAELDVETPLGWTPLIHAARKTMLAVQQLVEGGANVNYRTKRHGATALMYARNGEIAAYLLENGADQGIESAEGMTALDYARETGRADVVEVLLKAHEDVAH